MPRSLTARLYWHMLFFTAFFIVTIPVWAQTVGFTSGNRSNVQAADAKYSLRGTILDSVTGEPVRHALVQINGRTQRMVFSDAEGHFQFLNLPQMQASVNVIKPGFTQEGQSEFGNVRRAPISIGPENPTVTVNLVPEAEIHGRITDSAGEPLDGVVVKLFSISTQRGIRNRQAFRQVQSDEGGEFQFSDLAAGDYMISAGPSWKDLSDPFAPAGGLARFVYPQTFFPGVQELDAGTVLHMSAAQHERADFSLDIGRSFLVSGNLVGGVAHNSSLQFVNSAGQEISIVQRRDGSDGFRARLSAGPALIKARSNDDHGNHFYGQAEIDLSADLRGVRINMEQIQIPILVQRRSSPESNGSSQPQEDRPPTLFLISLDPVHPDASSEVTGEPGHWTNAITNIEFGRYRVELNETDRWYPESMTYGGVDLRFEPLVAGPGASHPIEISLRNDTATLAVKIDAASEKQFIQAIVVAVPEQSPSRPLSQAVFGSQQPVSFSLSPGRYAIYAFEDARGLEYADPGVMRKFRANAAAINVQPNQKTTVSVTLIRRTN